jgi:acyl carrier protein
VLGEHPAVAAAVVLVGQEATEDQRLLAYVVSHQKPLPTINELRRFAQEKLPEYMVPATFVLIDALPFTPTGKLDRRALPAPDYRRPEVDTVYVAPHTEIERTIASIWQDALGLERVGLQDNFFDLGGRSLLLVRVHSKLREVLDKDISMIDLFRNPTISSLAKYLNGDRGAPAGFQQTHDRAAKQKEAVGRLRRMATHRGH